MWLLLPWIPVLVVLAPRIERESVGGFGVAGDWLKGMTDPAIGLLSLILSRMEAAL